MNPLKTETDMFFARLASAIEAEERQDRVANGIANALAGSTETERKTQSEAFNSKCDDLEAKFKAAIAKAKGR